MTGQDAQFPTNIYVRPHELHIERKLNGVPAISASVVRVNPAGALARVLLATMDGRQIQVELSLERFDELGLRVGETVYVSAKHVRVFAPDYMI